MAVPPKERTATIAQCRGRCREIFPGMLLRWEDWTLWIRSRFCANEPRTTTMTARTAFYGATRAIPMDTFVPKGPSSKHLPRPPATFIPRAAAPTVNLSPVCSGGTRIAKPAYRHRQRSRTRNKNRTGRGEKERNRARRERERRVACTVSAKARAERNSRSGNGRNGYHAKERRARAIRPRGSGGERKL